MSFVNNVFVGELFPDLTLAGCIEVYENAWPDPEGTIAEIEKNASDPYSGFMFHRAGTLEAGANQNARTNYNLSITECATKNNNALAQNIHNQMYFLLLSTLIPHAKKFGKKGFDFHEEYNLLRYSGGQHYEAHYDGNTGTGRSTSAIIYLNGDYKGGEIEFVNFNVKIKPEPGMLILFPSNYAYSHIAHPVTEGTKYALVTWIRDRELNVF